MTKICFSPTVTLFETMMTTMNEANRDKKKIKFFCNVSLVCFTAELDE